MKPLVTLPAHFDGKEIKLDAAFNLQPNDKLLVTIIKSDIAVDEREEWNISSLSQLNKAYSIDEPDYSLSLVKEPNPDYGK